MIRRNASLIAGGLALAAIVAVLAGALGALAVTALTLPGDDRAVIDAYFWRVVRFTLWQAALSTILSVAFALPVARALARRPGFPGRRAILNLFALPLALPALVVVLGVVGLWGNQGWINRALAMAGLETGFDIYGLPGILIAHVFFNMPLAARLMVAHLDRIPGESWRLASQLGMTSTSLFRLIEWPVLRAGLPGIAALVFMLCIASFTVVLTLGGGPAATTVEVAIYQALRFDFDPARAVTLALVQLGFTGAFIAVIGQFALPLTVGADLGRAADRPDTAALGGRIGDTVLIVLATIFLVLPLTSVALDALAAPLVRLLGEAAVHRALATSLALAGTAAILAIALTWALVKAAGAARRRARRQPAWQWFAWACETGGSLILVMPPIVIGAGWFVLLRPVADVFVLAPVLVIVITALMAIPYASRILGPALAEAAQSHDRLCASLGVSGWNRFRRIDWPALKRPLGLAFAFAMALSLGDLGAIALFGSEDVRTLPLLLLQRMSSYRTADAAGLAGLLALLCLGLMWAADAAFGRGETLMAGASIELEHVRFRYEDMDMAFDLSVPASELTALIGPSGSGKTTILNLIAGFEITVSGTIRIDGLDVGALPAAARPVTMVFQDHNVFAHLDVATNVGLGISPALRLEPSDRDRVAAALARVGLEDFGRRLPGQLSGGERQRVALARCLVRDRPVLLLDEPFAALGPALRREMLDLIADIHRERAMTVLLVTHQPEDARRIAARTAFVHDGRILAVRPTDDLLGATDIPELSAYLGEVST